MKKINKLTQNHYLFGLTGMAAGYAISALIGAIATTVGTATNAISTAVTNKKNEDLTREAWTRDDMQLQRARQDAQKAGFSPLAALSNNLTNTTPATMQAPQIDASAIGNSISNIGRAYGDGKYNKEQIEALKIENKFNRQDLFNRRLQSVAQTAKLIKEVQGMDLDSAQKAQLLIDGGVQPSTVAKFFKPAGELKRSSMAIEQENLVKAQTKLAEAQKTLVDEQSTTQTNQRALIDAQEALYQIQKTAAENDNTYLNENLFVKGQEYTQPDFVKLSNGDYQIQYKKVSAKDNITRREYIEMINQFIELVKAHQVVSEINMSDWKKLGTILGALK